MNSLKQSHYGVIDEINNDVSKSSLHSLSDEEKDSLDNIRSRPSKHQTKLRYPKYTNVVVPNRVKTPRKRYIQTHNRSQSCPFIDPLPLQKGKKTTDQVTQGKQKKVDEKPNKKKHQMTKVKLEKGQKRKVKESLKTYNHQFKATTEQQEELNSPKRLENSRNFSEKKTLQHKYSNSLSHSSNTVIVHHNIPSTDDENISSMLYKEPLSNEPQTPQSTTSNIHQESNREFIVERNELKDKNPWSFSKNKVFPSAFSKKSEQKTIDPIIQTQQIQVRKPTKIQQQIEKSKLQKKSGLLLKSQQRLFVKTKIHQRIEKYKIKQEYQKLNDQSASLELKHQILDNLLQLYQAQK